MTDCELRAAKTPEGLNQAELRHKQVLGLVLRLYISRAEVWFLF